METKEIPKNVKDDIHTTIDYLYKMGPSFEDTLRKDDKFPFLKTGNEYYDYFIANYKPKIVKSSDDIVVEEANQPVENEPTEPYSYIFSKYTRNVSRRDLEIIQKTALYCVVNGAEHTDALRKKYSENDLLKFLDPSHNLYDLFTSFVKQYSLIRDSGYYPPAINLPKNKNNKSKKHIDLKEVILSRCYKRAEYNEYMKKIQTMKDKLATEHKIQFSAINWLKFKIIDNVNSIPDDAQRRKPLDFRKLAIATIDGSNSQLSIFDDSEFHTLQEQDQVNNSTGTEPNDKEEKKKNKKRMKIKAAGESRLKRKNDSTDDSARKKSKKLIKCPITNMMIEEQRFDKHLKTLLNDPTLFKEEKQRYQKAHNYTNLTTDDVYNNIKKLVGK
ncbi:Prp21p [Nakaseomyces bracarensis]|uniref:Prp21p n=1 Tax=Nakaseomyces bracarensis TaxID=273131 RepID=UPI0038714A5F